MKKIIITLALIASTQLTACAAIDQAIDQAIAQKKHQDYLRAKYNAPEGMDPEMLEYMDKSMTADREAMNDPNNVHGQKFWQIHGERCYAAAQTATNASVEALKIYHLVATTQSLRSQQIKFIQGCEMGYNAGTRRDNSEYTQLVTVLEDESKGIRTKMEAIRFAYDAGVVIAYKEGFKKAAGVYPVAG